MSDTPLKQYDKKIEPGQDQQLLRMLCDTLEIGVTILDKDLKYRFISDLVYKKMGISLDDLQIGDPLSKCHELMLANGMMTPEMLDKNKLSEKFQRERPERHTETATRMLKLGDGSTHRYTRKTLGNDYTIAMATDVTELIEKDDLLFQALKLGNAGYWIYDFKTKKYTLSPSLKEFYQKSGIEKIHSQGIFSIAHPDDRYLFKDALKTISPTNSRFEVTARTTNVDGYQLWVQTHGEVIRDKNGKPTKMQAFVKDITEQRQQSLELTKAKDTAIAASKAKSEFLANMSHEIRTPMNGILGMAELLENSDITESQRDYLEVINNSASALLTIINDILDFSKIEAGAFELDETQFDLKSSINDVTAILNPKAQQKGLELIINYPPSMPRGFIGDAGRLRQILTNLIGNAIKFTDNGYITIDVDVAEPHNEVSVVNFSVKDTGIGIPSDKVDGIFNKFTQADGSTTRMYGGTGLGLSISKAIVEMMDGRICVESILGQGSDFKFKVPLPIDHNAAERNYDITTLAGKRALIIDDILTNRQVLTAQLHNWGIESDCVKDGVEALTALKAAFENNKQYDIILLDYLMPGMNGQELATMMTHSETLGATPVIMLSSCDQPIPNDELASIGISSYLMKPVREKRLLSTILTTLSQNHKAPQNYKISKAALQATQEPGSKDQSVEILVAEDFPLNQDVVRMMLEDSIYHPVFANNGKEAVEIYKENPLRFPAILMDISMPVMNGYQATKLISAFEVSRHLSHVPIIALTGHALKNDREECLRAGMDDYLSKPVKQADLINKLEIWTGRAVKINSALAS